VSGAPTDYSVTGPSSAGDSPPPAALSAADRSLVAATFALLLVAPASASAGLRGAMLVIASAALVLGRGRRLFADLLAIPRPVLITVAAWGALATLSLTWSLAPRFTLSELRGEVLYGLLAFAIFFLAAARLARWRLWWIAIVTGTVAVFALLVAQQAGIRLSRHPMDGGPGPWSTHLVMLAPLLLAIAWPRPWGFDRGVVAKLAALILLMVAAAATGNRIVWAAFGAQLAVFIAISGSMPAMDPARLAMLRRLTVITALAVVIGFAASVLERNVEHYRFDPSVTASIDRDLRPKLWSVAWNEFRKAPLLGHGFGREILKEKFQAVTTVAPNHPEMRHSHNVFSDIALQLGVVGLALFLAVLAALAREYRGYLRDARLAPLGVIGLALIAGFVVKNLTDDFFYRHNALVFWALNGMLLGLGRPTSPRPPPAKS
jgi:O-antigen ligase